jgi:hypothetical protein
MAGRSGSGEWLDVGSIGDRVDLPLQAVETPLERGNEIAVGLSVSADVAADVLHFLEHAGIPASRFINLRESVSPAAVWVLSLPHCGQTDGAPFDFDRASLMTSNPSGIPLPFRLVSGDLLPQN